MGKIKNCLCSDISPAVQVAQLTDKKDGIELFRKIAAKLPEQQHGWRAKASKKYKATTNSNHQLPVAPNLLQQNFNAYAPNENSA